ncbi:MAG: hypothetical protein ACOH2M_09775, partial [Cypionkella sp.]
MSDWLPILTYCVMTIATLLSVLLHVVAWRRLGEQFMLIMAVGSLWLAAAFILLAISAGGAPIWPRESLLVPIRLCMLTGGVLWIGWGIC